MGAELIRSGWIGRRDVGDNVTVAPDGLSIRLGSRTSETPAERVGSVEVWRASDGLRYNRINDPNGNELALLIDQRWRVPGDGRLATLLRDAGYAVNTIKAPDDGDVRGESIRGTVTRRWPISIGWAAAIGAVIVVGALTVGVLGETEPEWQSEVATSVATLSVVYTLALAAAWLPGRLGRTPEPVVRPASGGRRGWLRQAGLGRDDRRLVACDGWGRVMVWPDDGDGAPVELVHDDAAAVMLDPRGRAVVRLPREIWAQTEETPDTAAQRIADALDLPRGNRPAAGGGDALIDPDPPSLAGFVAGCAGALTPVALALGAALAASGGMWVSAVAALAVAVAVAFVVALRIWRSLGQERRTEHRTASTWLLAYPLWAGGLVIVFLLTAGLVDDDVRAGFVGFLSAVGLVGIVLALRDAFFPLWRLAAMVTPVAGGVFALALRENLTVWQWWPSVVVGLAGALLVVREIARRAR